MKHKEYNYKRCMLTMVISSIIPITLALVYIILFTIFWGKWHNSDFFHRYYFWTTLVLGFLVFLPFIWFSHLLRDRIEFVPILRLLIISLVAFLFIIGGIYSYRQRYALADLKEGTTEGEYYKLEKKDAYANIGLGLLVSGFVAIGTWLTYLLYLLFRIPIT